VDVEGAEGSSISSVPRSMIQFCAIATRLRMPPLNFDG